jgi:hypothetical protein
LSNGENNLGADWQKGNAEYLAAAMTWLRACLEQCATPAQSSQSSIVLQPRPVPAEPGSVWRRFSKTPPMLSGQTPTLLPPAAAPGGEHVSEAYAAMQAAAHGMDPPPALLALVQRLGLSEFEQQLLILCLGMELDTNIAGYCARCQKDSGRNYPTFALAFALFEDASWNALSPERPLRYWRLIEITQSSGQPLTTSSLRIDERIVNYIKGLNYLDDRLLPLVSPLDQHVENTELPSSHQDAVDSIIRSLKQADANRSLPVVQLLGDDADSKELVAAAVANTIGLQLYRLPVALLPNQPAEIETLARLWQRESLLLPVGLYVNARGTGMEPAESGPASLVTRLLERTDGVMFLDTRDGWHGLHKQDLSVDVAKPTSGEQEAVWQSALGLAAGDNPAQLAAQFNLSFTRITQLARNALSGPSDQGELKAELKERLWQGILTSTRPQMDALAERITPKSTWDDIVLPDSESAVLHQIAQQVSARTMVYEKWGFAQKMSRGLGISALFCGESGVGKTMAAEVIANELHLNLYRIDLSAVVSKYIGETEKNLRRLFDATEDGGAILFFDEADALFGKRSEVKDSHDRYANIEINYLLQRMEAYRGLAILATNMKSALDTAFMRRLRFIVNFQFPGPAERKEIWKRAFPSGMPMDELDYDRLARLNVTGGHIHNIALHAAFLAARDGSPVSMPLVLEAAKAEFHKIERPINEADFRWSGAKKAVA